MSDIFRSGTSNQPTDFDPDQYNRHVKYFLDNEVSAIVYNLNPDEFNSFFEMCHRYPALLTKLFLLPGDPLMNYIMYGNEFYDALKNPHEGIDYTPSYIVFKYKEWAKENNIPEPRDMVVEEGLDTTPMLEFQQNL
jgi:hypothetical protein